MGQSKLERHAQEIVPGLWLGGRWACRYAHEAGFKTICVLESLCCGVEDCFHAPVLVKHQDMERFFTALMKALHDAYALGWKDRGEIKGGLNDSQPIAMRRGFARSAFGKTKVITPSRNSAVILSWSIIPEIRKLRR
jgi:hypothetical protein